MMLKAVLFAFVAVVFLAQDNSLVEGRGRGRDRGRGRGQREGQQFRGFLARLCVNNNAADKIGEVQIAVNSFEECVRNMFNGRQEWQVRAEIEQAKLNGALDEVFKRYCAKTPQLKTCIHTLMDSVIPCLDNGAREQFDSAKNGTDQLIDFTCYKDGARIALFVEEGGPECFKSKSSELHECVNKQITSFSNVEDAKGIAEKCAKFDKLSTCVVSKLETCSTPTPANLVESLFKYVRKGSPCNNALLIAVNSFAECIKNMFNGRQEWQVRAEIEQAKLNGALDEVFRRYCAKTPQLKTCILTRMDSVTPCFDNSAREQFDSAKNGTDQLIEFTCYKDGARIALFVEEGGPECFKSKSSELHECVNKQITSFSNVEDAKGIAEKCSKFDELSTCMVSKLETCSTPTPANLVESLFKYVRKGSPCNNVLLK